LIAYNDQSDPDSWPDKKSDKNKYYDVKNKVVDFISIKNASNFHLQSIYNTGVIDGMGKFWWGREMANANRSGRPHLVTLDNSNNAEMFGITFKDPGYVALNLYDVANVSIHNNSFKIDKKTLDNYGAKATRDTSTYLKHTFNNDGVVVRGTGVTVVDSTFDLYDRSMVFMPAYDNLHRQTRQSRGKDVPFAACSS